MDLFQKTAIKKRKIKKNAFRQKVCRLLGDMLQNGFSLQEALQFMAKLPKEEGYLGQTVLAELAGGKNVAEAFEAVCFSKNLLLQLSLAQIHGDLAETLEVMADTLTLQEKQQQALKKVMIYPALLLSFVFGILLVLKFFLLPQLKATSDFSEHSGLQSLEQLPDIVAGVLLGIFLISSLVMLWLKRQTPFFQGKFLSRFPFLGSFYRLYITAIFSREFGKLFKLGLDLRKVYEVLAQQKLHPLMQEMAKKGEVLAAEGQELTTTLASEKFFQKELVYMIQTGEMKGKLGDELLYFSQYLWQKLMEKIESALKWIQPLIFLFVAVLIVFLYAALLLPMYGNQMEVF